MVYHMYAFTLNLFNRQATMHGKYYNRSTAGLNSEISLKK